MLIAADSMKAVKAFKATITAAFDAHDLGEAAHFLGMAITRDRKARTIKLDQKTMAAQLVSKYGLDDGKPRGVPLSKSIELSRDTGEALDKDVYTYTHLVGSMLYMSVCTRPDIAQAVGALSKFMAGAHHHALAGGHRRAALSGGQQGLRDHLRSEAPRPSWAIPTPTTLVTWTRGVPRRASCSSCSAAQ